MADGSHIEWTEATWNPLVGCTKVSAGCDNCYAENLVNRFAGVNSAFPNRFDEVTMRSEKFLTQPLRWAKPRKVFVNSLSDLFHADVPDEFIADVFAVMALAQQHTFQLLTKRHARMRSLLTSDHFPQQVARRVIERAEADAGPPHLPPSLVLPPEGSSWWPLANVWLGVSVEDQRWADIRIPALLDTPAAVRWISAEPLLGPVSLRWAKWAPVINANHLDGARMLDWVVVGGESGPGARPMHPQWARDLRDQCEEAGVPFLFKQWGNWQNGSTPGDRGEHRVVVITGESAPWGDGDALKALSTRHGASLMARVGKKAAGRVLDGRTHDGYPTAPNGVTCLGVLLRHHRFTEESFSYGTRCRDRSRRPRHHERRRSSATLLRAGRGTRARSLLAGCRA